MRSGYTATGKKIHSPQSSTAAGVRSIGFKPGVALPALAEWTLRSSINSAWSVSVADRLRPSACFRKYSCCTSGVNPSCSYRRNERRRTRICGCAATSKGAAFVAARATSRQVVKEHCPMSTASTPASIRPGKDHASGLRPVNWLKYFRRVRIRRDWAGSMTRMTVVPFEMRIRYG